MLDHTLISVRFVSTRFNSCSRKSSFRLEVGHDLLQGSSLTTKVLHFIRSCSTGRVARQPPFAGLQELLRPAVIHRGGDTFAAAKLRDAFLRHATVPGRCGSSPPQNIVGVSDAECPSALVLPAIYPARISVSSSLLAATMNQNSSLREDPQFVPMVLMGHNWLVLSEGDCSDRARRVGCKDAATKTSGGKSLAMSSMYRLLSNPFYAGSIIWNGQTYPGKHEPIVSIDESRMVRRLIDRPNRPRPKHHAFTFGGMMRCGACGLGVTAERKVKRSGRQYTYYHCTRPRLRQSPCRPGGAKRRRPWSRILGHLFLRPHKLHVASGSFRCVSS